MNFMPHSPMRSGSWAQCVPALRCFLVKGLVMRRSKPVATSLVCIKEILTLSSNMRKLE